MFKRVLWFALASLAASPIAPQPASAQPAPSADASVSVSREVLERYVGCYELNNTVATVGLTEDGRLTARLTGQPPGPPLRTVSANEFAVDAIGARLFFEGEGPKATRIRSQYAGSEVVGRRIADAPAAAPASPGVCPAAASFDAGARNDVVVNLGSALRQRYVFPDIGEQAAARIDAALAAGEYDSLADPAAFAARLDADVGAIAHDKHLRINSMNAPPPPPPAGAVAMPRAEAGVVRADKLAGGVGYIEVVGFPPPPVFKPVIDRAMSGLAGSEALIIDVRRNSGGSPESVAYLVSFLLPPDQRVHINDIVTRVPGTNEFTRQSSFSEPTPVSFAGRPVYVLTSIGTFSGGEEFAYDVKSLDRGVLIGEVTAGGANPTGPAQLGNGLIASIPWGRAENPVTKTNWEGRGVEPDVAVDAADALKVALERLGQDAAADIASASQQQVFALRAAPLPGTEAAVRSIVAGLTSGTPDYASMSPQFAEVTRQQLPQLQNLFRPLGEIKSMTYLGPGPGGGDAFDVAFANGALVVSVMLGPDGQIISSGIRPGTPGG